MPVQLQHQHPGTTYQWVPARNIGHTYGHPYSHEQAWRLNNEGRLPPQTATYAWGAQNRGKGLRMSHVPTNPITQPNYNYYQTRTDGPREIRNYHSHPVPYSYPSQFASTGQPYLRVTEMPSDQSTIHLRKHDSGEDSGQNSAPTVHTSLLEQTAKRPQLRLETDLDSAPATYIVPRPTYAKEAQATITSAPSSQSPPETQTLRRSLRLQGLCPSASD